MLILLSRIINLELSDLEVTVGLLTAGLICFAGGECSFCPSKASSNFSNKPYSIFSISVNMDCGEPKTRCSVWG